jgi:signal transduction histidine kinase
MVEQNPQQREACRGMLSAPSAFECNVTDAATAAEALAQLDEQPVDCVLIGSSLPSGDRDALLGQLDKFRAQRPLAVILIARENDDSANHQATDQSFSAWLLQNDLTAALLQHVVAAAVERETMRHKIIEQSQQLALLNAMERERRAQLEQRIQERDTFLAMLSHELRNPLGAIAMAAELIQQDADPQQQSLGLRVILRQSHHMSRMLDELLDVARITQGKIELKMQPVAVATLIDNAVQSTQSLANASRHRLTVRPVDAGWFVHGDSTRLEQVLVNLLKNAIKFTPPSGAIEISARYDDPDIAISVRDNGAGVPASMQTAIFEPFVQTERTADRSQGGLGLGLAVVRKLVELHHGSVHMESRGAGQGSLFTICLPAAQTLHGSADLSTAPRGPHRDVLVIEDSPDARDMMSRLLRLLGHHVSVAEDGQRGLDALRARQYDVALVDIGLPIMDGYQLARSFRALPDARSVRLIAVTGYGNPEDRRQALEAGFDEHVVKPVNLARLAELVNSNPLNTA